MSEFYDPKTVTIIVNGVRVDDVVYEGKGEAGSIALRRRYPRQRAAKTSYEVTLEMSAPGAWHQWSAHTERVDRLSRELVLPASLTRDSKPGAG